MLNEDLSVQNAIFQARPNLWILAGGKSLAGVKRSIGRKDFSAEYTLAEALKPLEGQFDYTIIDTAPSWDTLTINALFYASEVLTLNSLVEFVKSIESVKRFNRSLKHQYVLPTFLDGRVKKSTEILDLLRNHFPAQLCEPIKYNVRISESAGFGQTIFEYAPNSSGAKDYKKVVERILNDE